ncbi:NAD(P)-dependent oxidoreductase [Mesorhizobium sp. M7A.F.Ca.US.011.01.1.1]|uniref:NAD-dependent epimerase/dehydratase family protein n=1 Tax=Mesorhizobium sp. M7A.F.Ca.US.011.01.1.1 TaxID=2496741 RepID=UPI000FCAD77E|nr:NAD(P)-dependent oxidoreductase [Mesorhizobium sp. M7A.F.Ca.US.011.01.1.1]RUX22550.1 NAD(P)-dependent oxidoreductase [Mesorhizobium sp. M7A.F.Ca.US.011.01.1.1]
MAEKKTLVLTGAAGNMGRDLRPLLREGYLLRTTARQSLEPAGDETFLLGDLTDPNFCSELVAGADGVLHLAGAVGPALSFEQTLDANYRVVLNLLEACHRADVERFIFASSHHAVGLHSADERLDHTAPAAPDGYYGLSKIFGEAACAMYAYRYGLRVLNVRIGNADPKIVDGRRERIWLSAEDMVQLVDLGMTHPTLGCETVYGVSSCPSPIFDNVRAEALGYHPAGQAAVNHAQDFRPLEELPPADTASVGGYFATLTLPPPKGFDA